MKEADIESRFCRMLKARGYMVIKMGMEGWPDRLVVGPEGQTGYIEFKTSSGNLSKLQRERVNWLAEHDHCVFVIRDCGLDTVEEFINDMAKTARISNQML